MRICFSIFLIVCYIIVHLSIGHVRKCMPGLRNLSNLPNLCITPYSDAGMQVKQQQTPHSGEQCGDAKKSNRYGRETAACQIRAAVGIVDVDDDDEDEDDRPVGMGADDVVKRLRGDDEVVVIEN